MKIRPSTKKGKKIDVLKDGELVASIGARGYLDYPTYLFLERQGAVEKGTAKKKRKSYKARHENNRHKKGSPGYYADKILWPMDD